MNRKCNLAFGLATGLLLGMHVAVVEAEGPGQVEEYLIGSGVPGSVPYNIGVGLSSLAQLVLLPEKSLKLSPAATDGYGQNLQQILDGTNQFAIVDSVAVHQSSSESGDQLMAVATLWHEVDHFIIANEYVQSGTISDLAILRRENLATSLGNFDATSNLLARFGVRLDGGAGENSPELETQFENFNNGLIAGLAISGSAPSEAVLETLQQRGGRAQLLEFSHWQLSQVAEGWHVHPLTAEDYPGLTTQVDTVARKLMLAVHRDVPEEAVYQVVKTMYENLPYLTNLDETAAQISLDHAQDSDLPLHPGAIRYYQEVGVLAEGQTGHEGHAGHAGHGQADGTAPPEHVHDEAMLTRARAEAHDGEVILKIGRPAILTHPETEISMVYFGLGKIDLADDGIAKTREIASRIMATYERHGREPEVYIEGHTDSTGSWEINYEIAHRRALSVRNVFVDEGVPESWIHISDYSEQGLAVPTADDVAEERNRRVEITVIPQE